MSNRCREYTSMINEQSLEIMKETPTGGFFNFSLSAFSVAGFLGATFKCQMSALSSSLPSKEIPTKSGKDDRCTV